MKIIRIITPLLLLALVGCKPVFEDLSNCPASENVTIKFSYIVGGSDLFSANVSNVEMAIFNQAGDFVMRKTVSRAELEADKGTTLDLDPGVYRIVCWGNVTDLVTYPDLTGQNISTAAIMHANSAQGWSENGECLFYAPYIHDITNPDADIFTITVPQGGDTIEVTMNFAAAHNTFDVYVKGADETPKIEITKMAQKYNFSMQASELRMSYIHTARNVNITGETGWLGASYSIPQFDQSEDNIYVNITTSNSNWQISLKQFLADNNITIDQITHQHIQIKVEYANGTVEVTIPSWSGGNVTPEIE